MPVLALSNIADSVASVTSGVLRGSGRQELAFKVNLGVREGKGAHVHVESRAVEWRVQRLGRMRTR